MRLCPWRGAMIRKNSTTQPDDDLTARAAAGDRLALQELLLAQYDRLAARIARKVPLSLQGVVAADDILQETFASAFRSIRSLKPKGAEAFYRWLATIAERRLQNAVKALHAAKRGGGRARGKLQAGGSASSVVDLLDRLAIHDHTPSRSAARHEAASVVRVALAGLKNDYRVALNLRYLEGLPVAEAAAKMKRTERAIHNLCYRGLKQLREALESQSHYLTRKH